MMMGILYDRYLIDWLWRPVACECFSRWAGSPS